MSNDEHDGQAGAGAGTLAAGAASLALDVALSAEPTPATSGDVAEPGFLLFRCAGVDCAVPLVALREVLPRCPVSLPLPHSPDWLLGVFALRAELIGLVDPAPLLLGAASERTTAGPYSAALIAGAGERVLAWAVESIGATAPFTAEAAGVASGEWGAAGLGAESPAAAAYTIGVIAPEPGRRCVVIDVEALLAEMLRALEERPAER